ncbi:MAG TPA: hypothetical protein VE890_12015, partial [Thermoguttaceae bacterium]|nr:hypothetical protein [Thermoguttaceae bacterium]
MKRFGFLAMFLAAGLLVGCTETADTPPADDADAAAAPADDSATPSVEGPVEESADNPADTPAEDPSEPFPTPELPP